MTCSVELAVHHTLPAKGAAVHHMQGYAAEQQAEINHVVSVLCSTAKP